MPFLNSRRDRKSEGGDDASCPKTLQIISTSRNQRVKRRWRWRCIFSSQSEKTLTLIMEGGEKEKERESVCVCKTLESKGMKMERGKRKDETWILYS